MLKRIINYNCKNNFPESQFQLLQMSGQLQNIVTSTDYTERQKKLKSKKLNRIRFNVKQKKLKLLLTKLIKRLNKENVI